MSARPPIDSPVGLPLPSVVRTKLGRLARKDLNVRLARFPLLLAIFLPLYWLFQAMVDLVFNLSWGARVGFLTVSVLVASWLFYRHVIVPIRKRLKLRSSALLVERKFPQFRSSLISAVDFTTSRDGSPAHSAALVQILLGQVGRMMDRTDVVGGIVDAKPVRRLFFGALAVAAGVAGLAWYFQPQSLVLARRIFLSADPLPSRTSVEAVTKDFTLDTGDTADLAARARGVVPRNAKVVVAYADGRRETMPVSVSTTEAGVFRLSLRNVLQPFRYHFEVNDGVSPEFEVKTRALPVLTKMRFLYIPPQYTGRPETELPAGSLSLLAGSRLVIEGEANQPLKVATLDLKGFDQKLRMDNGDQADNLRQRIAVNEPKVKELKEKADALQPAVAETGSAEKAAQQVADEAKKAFDATSDGDLRRKRGWELEKASNALREAREYSDRARAAYGKVKNEWEALQRQAAEQKKQLERILAEPPPEKTVLEKRKKVVRAEIVVPGRGLNGLSMHLVNEDGLESENDAVYRVNISTDRPPTVEVLEPRSDRKTVLAQDKVLVEYRVRDDYRIERVSLRYVVLRPNAEGEAVPSEEDQTIPLPFPAGATTVASQYVLDLGAFVPALTEGVSVSYWIEAADYQTLYKGGVASRKMVLNVVSPEVKKAELVAEMQKAAKEIERLSERQRKANQKTDSSIRR